MKPHIEDCEFPEFLECLECLEFLEFLECPALRYLSFLPGQNTSSHAPDANAGPPVFSLHHFSS